MQCLSLLQRHKNGNQTISWALVQPILLLKGLPCCAFSLDFFLSDCFRQESLTIDECAGQKGGWVMKQSGLTVSVALVERHSFEQQTGICELQQHHHSLPRHWHQC